MTLQKDEERFLALIRDNPGIDAKSLPRKRRGEILKTLELNNLIQYGPGGWYPVEKGPTP